MPVCSTPDCTWTFPPGIPYPDPMAADGVTSVKCWAEPPAHKANWIQTLPGKGWDTILRQEDHPKRNHRTMIDFDSLKGGIKCER